jgi:hypothetical protein
MVFLVRKPPVCALEIAFSAPKFSIFVFQMVLFLSEVPVFLFEISVCLLEAAVLALEGGVLAEESVVLTFKTSHLALKRGIELFFTSKLTSKITDFEFNELSATKLGRGSSIGGYVNGMAAFAVLALAVFTFTVLTLFAVAVTTTTSTILGDGLSNDGCNGSSSKNECDGKFDLNHFE